ncbi:TolB family protein [Roseateles sp. BYS78W]|uniref:TolB family protein n=1 Tax=Pelomonas candidula TaxID=3299025 RepID=A0ABW7HCI3_9BURK
MSFRKTSLLLSLLLAVAPVWAQIGQRFPSEKRVVNDPVTGTPLTFLTTQPHGDSKIYPSHPQWTADGQWLVFRSNRVKGEAIAVNEASGEMVQVTEGGYDGMLNLSQSGGNKLYFLRKAPGGAPKVMQAVEVDLDRVFADSKAGAMKPASSYQRVFATLPAELEAVGDNALDADGQWFYFRIQGKAYAGARLPAGTKIEAPFGPRGMGAGPHAIGKINVKTGEIKHVVSVPFQIGHIQSNLWNPGELVFSWETGGKSPQRTWTVKGDGTGLRPLYPEAPYEWVTHEAVIGKDEVALAIMGHRAIPGVVDPTRAAGTAVEGANPGQDDAWGNTGTREKPTGLAIVNLRTREVNLVGQTPSGSGLWHVHGSPDGRFATGDDFGRSLYLIDRKTHEMIVLTAGHKTTARDHIHPTFSPDGRKIEIQSAMLAADGREMNICIVPVPQSWLDRK